MSEKGIERLIRQAKEDPKFFHDLVFNTESVLEKIDYLDRGTKGAILATSPEDVISELIGTGTSMITGSGLSRRGMNSGGPIGVRACTVSCTSSCGFTCGTASCTRTTAVMEEA